MKNIELGCGPLSRWKNWKSEAKKLRDELYIIYLSIGDPRVSKFTKILAALIILYALSPIDLIPDFIPVLGMVDDLIILPAAIALLLKSIPEEVISDCRKKVERKVEIGWKKWLGALLILTVWALIIVAILIKLMRQAS